MKLFMKDKVRSFFRDFAWARSLNRIDRTVVEDVPDFGGKFQRIDPLFERRLQKLGVELEVS